MHVQTLHFGIISTSNKVITNDGYFHGHFCLNYNKSVNYKATETSRRTTIFSEISDSIKTNFKPKVVLTKAMDKGNTNSDFRNTDTDHT